MQSDISGAGFTPLVVVELAKNTNQEAIGWLLGRIRDEQQGGGEERRAALLHGSLPLATAAPEVVEPSHLCQVLTCWWSSWGWGSEVRRRTSPTPSWWGRAGSGSSPAPRSWGSSRSTTTAP